MNRKETPPVPSTNLSGLTIYGMKPGQNIKDLDFGKYKKNSDFQEKVVKNHYYKYYKDFSVVYDSDGNIIKLKTLSLNAIQHVWLIGIHSLDDVTQRLGNNFVVSKYDKAQRLSSRDYYDNANKLRARFVFPEGDVYTTNNQKISLVWVILEKY
ncbi:peptidase M56 [Paenibacillus albidus]|nr:peptidase M56 [Paenibacillus albidus]